MIPIESTLYPEPKREVTIGAEMEVYIVDLANDSYTLLNDQEVCESIYNALDERIFRDYYPYQLEIRTNPHDNPYEVADELVELFKQANREAKQQQCVLIPLSYLPWAMYCGMHVHVSTKRQHGLAFYLKWAMAMYPLLLPLYVLTASSLYKHDYWGVLYGYRLINSPHIQYVPITDDIDEARSLIDSIDGSRYNDVSVNRHRRDGRHRVKDVTTVEIRMFDVVGDYDVLKSVLECVYGIASRVKFDWIRKITHDRSIMRRVNRLLEEYRTSLIKGESRVHPLFLATIEDYDIIFATSGLFRRSWTLMRLMHPDDLYNLETVSRMYFF